MIVSIPSSGAGFTDLLYTARHVSATTATDHEFSAGFIHVPLSHEQAAVRDEGEPSIALETMEGVLAELEVACSHTVGQNYVKIGRSAAAVVGGDSREFATDFVLTSAQ